MNKNIKNFLFIFSVVVITLTLDTLFIEKDEINVLKLLFAGIAGGVVYSLILFLYEKWEA